MLPEAVRAYCDDALRLLFEELPDLRTAVLATMDGYPVSSWGSPNTRIVVMAGTLQALASAFSKECQGEALQSLMMQAAAANLIVTPVSMPSGDTLVLAVVADQDVNLGLMRRGAIMCAERIKKSMAMHEQSSLGALNYV